MIRSIRFSSRISRSLERSRVRKLLGFRKGWTGSRNLTRQAVRILAKLKDSGNWIAAGLVGCLVLLSLSFVPISFLFPSLWTILNLVTINLPKAGQTLRRVLTASKTISLLVRIHDFPDCQIPPTARFVQLCLLNISWLLVSATIYKTTILHPNQDL